MFPSFFTCSKMEGLYSLHLDVSLHILHKVMVQLLF
jgi:hypothetical protein